MVKRSGFNWFVFCSLVTWGRSKDFRKKCWEVLRIQLVFSRQIESINWHDTDNTQGFPCIRWSWNVIVFDRPSYVELPVSSYTRNSAGMIQGYPRFNLSTPGLFFKRGSMAERKKKIRNQLPNLQHLEGSVFSVLLRARSLGWWWKGWKGCRKEDWSTNWLWSAQKIIGLLQVQPSRWKCLVCYSC